MIENEKKSMRGHVVVVSPASGRDNSRKLAADLIGDIGEGRGVTVIAPSSNSTKDGNHLADALRDCANIIKKKSTSIKLGVVVGFERSFLAELFWLHDIPVVQIIGEAPQGDEEARLFYKYLRYLGAIIYTSEEVRDKIHRDFLHAEAIASHVFRDSSQLASRIEQLILDLETRRDAEMAGRSILCGKKFLDTQYSYPWLRKSASRAIADYTTSWSTGINLRKPFPGFHPGVYAEMNGVKGIDPSVHYILAEQPAGSWSTTVIRPGNFRSRRKSCIKAAIQLHIYYPEMAADLIYRIGRSKSRPDIFVSVPTEQALIAVQKDFMAFNDRKVVIRIVPNRGRDIGPILTEFAAELEEYEVIGHFHTKKSLQYANRIMVKSWNNFLAENVLGGKKAMIDVILQNMENDSELGLVFPDDPDVIGWTKNRDQAVALMKRMGINAKLPERFINFPVGTMFWARTAALQPLFDLKIDWTDYPEEPTPVDGTILHAIERILPLVSEQCGFRNAVTHVMNVLK